MPKEYVESINYEYNKVDGQTYINVNVVRPSDVKPKPESTKTKSSLKAPTGPSLTQQQREELLAQQQLQQQQQQQELLRQQELEEQQLLEQQRLEQEQRRLEQEELEEQQRLEEEQALTQQQQELEQEATVTGRSYRDELIKIELRKLELKELDLRRKEIRDLETRRNELLNSITALRPSGTQRRGYSQDVAKSFSSVSRSSSVGSLHKSRQSRIHTARVSYAPTVPAEQPAATLRPPAPSNYQNENLVQQPSTRTIAQLPGPSKQTQRIVNDLTPTLVERNNNQHKLPTSTQFERELGLPTASQWVRAVQNENKQVWFQKPEPPAPVAPFAQQQAPPTFGANPFNTTAQQPFPQYPTQTANLSAAQFATQFPTQTANLSTAQFAAQFPTQTANLSAAQFATQFPMSQFGQQQNFSNPLLAQAGVAQQFYQQSFF